MPGHQTGVTAQRVRQLPGPCVPNSYRGVGTSCGQPATVAAEGDREHIPCVGSERVLQFT
jgi:hypothetical protein